MKEKIYLKLKQVYSSLGLGDEVLQAHAESLASLGLVTDGNLDAVVNGQKAFFEGLQKEYDRRASSARKSGEESAKAKFEEEQKKAEEERKRIEDEEKKKKAEEKARKKAEEEELARKQAEEEAEKKRLEELKAREEIPEWFKKDREESAQRAKAEREAYEARIAELTKASNESTEAFKNMIAELQEKNKSILDGYNAIKEENEKQKAQAKIDAHRSFVLNKAKELGIPQWRIDEGFTISDDAEESAVIDTLSRVSANIKANALPSETKQQLGGGKATKEDMDAVANLLIH